MVRRNGPLISGTILSLLQFWSIQGALNIDFDFGHHLVDTLRKHIFVDTSYLEEHNERQCSSEHGPGCLRFLLGHGTADQTATRSSLDGSGVIPDVMLQAFHDEVSESADFKTTLSVDMVRMFHGRDLPESVRAAAIQLQAARAHVESGHFNFAGLGHNVTVPQSFSEGLPKLVDASWEGDWFVRRPNANVYHHAGLKVTQSEVSASILRKLPAPSRKKPVSTLLQGATAQLRNSLGYIRFSSPVVVQLLLVSWESQSANKALIGGRMRSQNVWTTHLDPSQFEGQRSWVDISGDVEHVVDELVFIGAAGLEIGAIAASVHQGREEGATPVIMLRPHFNHHNSRRKRSRVDPGFRVIWQNIALAAARSVITLQEAILSNLRFHMKPGLAKGGPRDVRQDDVAGCWVYSPYLAIPEAVERKSASWVSHALVNQQMYEHALIPTVLARVHSVIALRNPLMNSRGGVLGRMHSEALTDSLYDSQLLPVDLKTQLSNARHELLDALDTFVHGRPLRLYNASTLVLSNGTLTSTQSLIASLDLLTASFLHLRAF